MGRTIASNVKCYCKGQRDLFWTGQAGHDRQTSRKTDRQSEGQTERRT